MQFPLNFTATNQRASESVEDSGQRTKTYADVSTGFRCLFYEMSGSKVQGPTEGHQGIYAFYTTPDTDIREGDLVYDIKDRYGSVVEPGPFYVESAKKVANTSGVIHHISCKLKGVAN